MTRDEFVGLHGNTQWAIVDVMAFGGEYQWCQDKNGKRFWVDGLGDKFPDMIDMLWMASWLNACRIYLDISTNLYTPYGWFVKKSGREFTHSDPNLPWAILKACEVDTDSITEPIMKE